MTSAQLILVSVSSALIAVIAMLVVATVLRARTRDTTGGELSQTTGPQTRAQRAATRAQGKAQRATLRAERKAQKAAASVAKAELAKAEKEKAAALVAAKNEPAADTAKASDGAPDSEDAEGEDAKGKDVKGDALEAEGSGAASTSDTTAAPEAPSTPNETDVLAVPEKQEDEVATTEAGKRASEAKPRARKSLLGRGRSNEASTEEKS